MMSQHSRLRLTAALVTLIVIGVIGFAYNAWRLRLPSSGSRTYRQMVSAFYSGVLALDVGDQVQAGTSLLQATQIVPQEPAAWADLGVFEMRSPPSNYVEAAQALGKAHDLAPNNARIIALLGILADQQGQTQAAIAEYQRAIALDPHSLRARYALIHDLQQQAGPQGSPQAQQQLEILFQQAPQNLFVDLEEGENAARAGDAATLHHVLARLAARRAAFPADAQSAFDAVQAQASKGAGPEIVGLLIGLRNLLSQSPVFQNDQYAVLETSATTQNAIGRPLVRFVALPTPTATPAPPDMTTHFTPQPLPGAAPGHWAVARLISLTPEIALKTAREFSQPVAAEGPPSVILANGRQVLVGAQSLSFPGGPRAASPTPDGILTVDWRYTFRPGLICAGRGGVRFYQQQPRAPQALPAFADVTAQTKLPPSILQGAYTGAWAADVDLDGALDIVLGSVSGPPTVLRNNGDGTFTPIHPFPGAISGIRGFAWGDFDGSGAPDAALIDAGGVLHVFQNERSGLYRPWTLPADLGHVAAVSVADVNQGPNMQLITLSADGTIRALARRTDGGQGWTETTLAHWPAVPTDGSARLRWADLDNNGGADLIATGSSGSAVWMCDAQNHLQLLPAAPAGDNLTVDVQDNQERQNLIGLNAAGQPVQWVNTGTAHYHWQIVRPRAAYVDPATGSPQQGDQRVNSFGLGGEAELRAGLLYEKLPITGPALHFGLGTYTKANYLRIVWPNGSPQGEFNLTADQPFVAPQRLIGSCPWVFADNGYGMHFVTDFLWRSPLGLRINAQATAGVVQTQDWVKIRGDQLVAKNGFYHLAITADLWETHFFDYLRLMTVDHPIGTRIYVDERFAIPPPPLKVYAMTPPVPALKATDDLGHDVTAIIRKRDGVYLDTFGRGPYQGITRDHYVQLDLGPAPDRAVPQWLVAQGWIHPTDSSINVAISQGHHAPPRPLSLEIPNGQGGWRTVRPNLGFPEGKNKTCLINITGLFPPGADRQVRLRTDMEIYWDFLGSAAGLPQTPLRMQRLAPAVANLHYRGFSATHQANPSSPEVPDYAVIARTAPRWMDLIGYYTRYGDVRPLLAKISDRYVIMNAGDEMTLKFAAPPPPPPGWTRDFVLIGDGWVKDGNLNTEFSRTVLPLPSHSRPNYHTPPGPLEDDPVYKAHRHDWLTYQTRYVTPRPFRDALIPDPSRPSRKSKL